MTPVETARKVRQLDNEVQAIYEMLVGIETTQRRHSNRFQEIAARLDEVDQTLTARIDGVEQKVDTVLDLLRNGASGPA
jgi:septation ring formation regulator EzrA